MNRDDEQNAQPGRRAFACGVAAFAVAGAFPKLGRAADGPLIAAASSVRFALDEILALFEAETGVRVRVSYGSSGNLFRQIMQGAPFELFLSADDVYVDKLVQAGKAPGGGLVYAQGRLALAARKGSSLGVDEDMAGLRRALDAGTLGRFAIANPRFAPYGRRAEEALRHAGLWDAVRPRLVFGESVGQAAQFVVSKGTDGGIIALSHAVTPQLRDRLSFVPVNAAWHASLRQRQVLLKGAGAPARALRDFIVGPDARAVFQRNGFAIPGENG